MIKCVANRQRAIDLDGRCMKCGSLVNLTPHHIITRSDDIGNIITFCFTCHRLVHDGYKTDDGEFFGEYTIVLDILRGLKDEEYFRWGMVYNILEMKYGSNI